MASFNTSGIRHFLMGATAISAFTRVTVNSSGVLICAGPTGACVGNLDMDGAPNDAAPVRLATATGSRKYIADTAITAWGYVYASLSGYATNSGNTSISAGTPTGITLGLAAAPSGQVVAATALGSVFEVISLQGST